MLNEEFMVEFCNKLRAAFKESPDTFFDVMRNLDDMGRHDATEDDARELAKSVLADLNSPRKEGDLGPCTCGWGTTGCPH